MADVQALHTMGEDEQLLHHFNDTVLSKIELTLGCWVIFGRVYIQNLDDDPQHVTVRMFREANMDVDLDTITIYQSSMDAVCYSLHALVALRKPSTITLMCNTYHGQANKPMLLAMVVDVVEEV